MTSARPRLAFVSPLFLFPTDAGGKIRTNNILRGMKGGAFDITLIAPATDAQQRQWRPRIEAVCDRFVAWPAPATTPIWRRGLGLLNRLPINVLADRQAAALAVIAATLGTDRFDLVVFDFVHAAVLKPDGYRGRTVCFTHNVEAEIFARHAAQASNGVMRTIWKSQYRKMVRFEAQALRGFSSVIAVSARDARYFEEHYRIARAAVIPTGVDLDFFSFEQAAEAPVDRPPTVIFTGVMDWIANIDGVQFFLADIWPLVIAEIPEAAFVVVGRNPSSALRELATAATHVTVTGFVDDVRPHVHAADVFVIPLRVGGGTRIKAFEAMAMGCPVVATTVGIEGLDLVADEHFVLADRPSDIAAAIVDLLRDAPRRRRLALAARQVVETQFGHAVASRVFEQACVETLAGPVTTG